MSRKPKIGVVGVGTFGINHLRVFSEMAEEGLVELAAMCDANEETLAERRREFPAAAYADFSEMLQSEDLDAVTVATPDHLHRDIALAAIAEGRHVLVEKPMDVTVEGCEAMAAAAADRGVLLQVDLHKRCDPYHIGLHDQVREGKLGKILYGSAVMEDRIEVPRDWFPHWAPSSSPVWFLGVHMFDLIRWIIGDDPAVVYATGQKEELRTLGVDTYDSVQVHVRFVRGSGFTFSLSWILPEGWESIVNQEIRVVGTEGVMEIDSQYRGARGCLGPQGMTTPNPGGFREHKDRHGRTRYGGYVMDSIREFGMNLRLLANGADLAELDGSYAAGRDGIEATRMAAAAHESLEKGVPVRVRE